MDHLIQYFWAFWAFITVSDNATAIQTLLAISAAIIAILSKPWNWFKGNAVTTETGTVTQNPTPVEIKVNEDTIEGGLLKISLDDYEARLALKLAEKEEELTTAHGEETAVLQQQIDELTRRAQNPKAALAEAQNTIRKLEETLTREGNAEDISEARMTEAREALEAGDFSIADDIFAEIETREQIAVERSARAAFARGEIAEQEIRWTDAAVHYTNAARRSPGPEYLNKARWMHWNAGNFSKALAFGEEMVEAAEQEFGKNTQGYATAINNHALGLVASSRYDEAEPLFKQAIEIDINTIGAKHPDYAIRLNNLAYLYESMGRYDEAEPLYIQAIEIGKDTIGEKHPDYATHLNNLANLYESMGRYDEAKPLYKQAIEIDKDTIGEKHPDYAIDLNNLANLYYSMGRYDEAEPLYKQAIKIAEPTLGSDHRNTITFKSNLARLQSAR